MYIADGRKFFYQWDADREMIVTDPDITELHFCNGRSECSLVCEVKNGRACVPNILLQTAGNIRIYGFAEDHTEVAKIYKVFPRTKPEDYVYTETEVKRYETLEHEVESLKQYVDDALANDNMFVVHAEGAPPVLDKTYAQISEAVAAKKTILLTYNSVGEAGTTFYYAGFEDNKHVFTKIHKPTTPQPDGRIGIHESQIIVSPDNTAVHTIAMPATTPNPYKLIFNGAVNAEYDGSRDVKIEIPESGGSGLPTGGAPHQMLVTDADGNAQWEDRLCYETFEDVTFLAEQAFAINEDGIGVIPAFLATPAAGDLCAVGWNGTEYTCTATALTVEGLDVVALGNASAFGGEISDEPFAIMILPEDMAEVFGAAGQMFVLDDSQTVTLSISGKQSVVKKLDPRYVEIKGESVFLDMSVADDFSDTNTFYPYAMLLALVNAGKNIIMTLHTASDVHVECPIFLRLGAIDAAGMHFMGHASATGEFMMLTLTEGGESSLNIGAKSLTLTSPNGRKWSVYIEDDGTLKTAMM